MSRLLETIRIENGVAGLASYHQARIDRSLHELFGRGASLSLQQIFRDHPPPTEGIWKCRVVYGENLSGISYELYQKKSIRQLILTDGSSIRYNLKFADRKVINRFTEGLNVDQEVLFVTKGMLTDTSYTNIAVLDTEGIWLTPMTPILMGTRRQSLLDLGLIKPANILAEDLMQQNEKLKRYIRIRLFNAMIPFSEAIEIDLDQQNLIVKA